MSGRSGHHAHFVCRVEPLADLRQQRLDLAGTRQMQQHPILILFDPSGNLEQRENDRFGLSIRQRGALQPQLAQLLVQDTC